MATYLFTIIHFRIPVRDHAPDQPVIHAVHGLTCRQDAQKGHTAGAIRSRRPAELKY
jgi:hypothetical protein